MLSTIRRRVTYANVAMTLALVFAMSGGAYAAGKFLITSTKQIKPSVLSALKGKAGPAGPVGPAGAVGPAGGAGPQGSAGPQGTAGVKGETGAPGASGTNGKNGTNGKEGSPWTVGGTLPVGATETGTLATPNPEVFVSEPSLLIFLPISFTIPLAAELDESHVEVVKKGVTGTNCTGAPSNPTAPSGFLCVYLAEEKATTTEYFIRKSGLGSIPGTHGASKAGAIFAFELFHNEQDELFGTWAVTG